MRQLLNIRPDERAAALSGFSALFLVLAGHTVLETARDALFLAKLPPTQLPWAYLCITAGVMVVTTLNQRVLLQTSKRVTIAATPALLAILTALAWPLVKTGADWALFSFYVWTGLVGTILVAQVWSVFADVFDVSQAKRIYPLVGFGALLGATFGAVVAGVVVEFLPAHVLLPVGAAFIAASGVGPACLRGNAAPVAEPQVSKRDARSVTRKLFSEEPFLWRLLVLSLAVAMTVTVVDFLFKATIAESYQGKQLGVFLARFYAGVNASALVVQLVVGPMILRRLGVHRALLVMPLTLAVAAIGIVLPFAVLPFVVMKAVDGAMRHSVHRTSFEFLYLPLSTELRARTKTFIDGVGQRGGQALASMGILGALALGASVHALACALALLLPLWAGLAWFVRRDYVRLFKQQLKRGFVDRRLELPELDLKSLELLVGALNSNDDAEVLAALDLFAAYKRVSLIPQLILYHPSPEVVLRALGYFQDAGHDVLSVAQRLTEHTDPRIRGAAIRYCGTADLHSDLLHGALQSSDPYLLVNAVVALAHANRIEEPTARAALEEFIHSNPLMRQILAQALHGSSLPFALELLEQIVETQDREAIAEVALALEARPKESHIPLLLQMLPYRAARPAVRRALATLGKPALNALDVALEDPTLERRLRIHIPRTIGRFAHAESVAMLQRHMWREPDGGIRYKILRGLVRLRGRNPNLPADRSLVEKNLRRTLRRAVFALRYRLELEALMEKDPSFVLPVTQLLQELLAEKERNAIGRLFRLFRVLLPQEEFKLIYDGLRGSDPRLRAGSREVLEHVVPDRLKAPLLSLISDESDEERLRGARAILEGESSALPERSMQYTASQRALISCLMGVVGEGSWLMRHVALEVAATLQIAAGQLEPDVDTGRSKVAPAVAAGVPT